MRVTYLSSESTPNIASFSDKVMGEFKTREQLDGFVRVLERQKHGIETVEVLEGKAGECCLGKLKKSVEGFLDAVLGDAETEMLHAYEQAVAQGSIVFAIPVTAESRDEVVKLAIEYGAKNVAHFGTFVNETFEVGKV